MVEMNHRQRFIPMWIVFNSAFFSLHTDLGTESHKPTINYVRTVTTPGNITLGGLFPIFIAGKKGKCTIINSALGVPQLEALLFSIDLINANKTLLPNTTLGLKAFDTCGSETAALDRAVKGFVLGEDYVFGVHEYMEHSHSVVGVVGPGHSYEAVHVSPFLGLFNIPLISYGATSSELSDKSKYKYFSRTLPSDSLQGKVILEILKMFNWTYVSVVYSDEPYGRSGYDVIKNEAKYYGICFAKIVKLPQHYSRREYKMAVRQILSDNHAKAVVVFCMESVIPRFVKELHRHIGTQQLQLIGSETLGMLRDWVEVRSIATGVLFTLPTGSSVPAFNNYFLDLSVDNNGRNPWFRDFFQATANCSLKENARNLPLCNTTQTLRNINYTVQLEVFNTVPFVIDSVYAFAHALHLSQEQAAEKRHRIWNVPGNQLLKNLRTLNFGSFTGTTVKISDTGDVSGGYGIYYMDEVQQGIFENIKIGEWQAAADSGKQLKILANRAKRKFHNVLSHCWETCQAGEIRQGVAGKPSCCSTCVPCPDKDYVANETICQSCANGYVPDQTRRMCVPLEIKYFRIDGRLVSFVPVILSGLSIIALLFTVVVFIRHNNTPMVKASAREFSYLLLVGLFLSYLYPFFAVLKPSQFICFLRLVFDSLPFTICLVAIAVKSNRVSRIFNRNRKSTSAPLFVKPQYQIAVALALISFQVLLLIVVVIFGFPYEKLVFPSSTEVRLVCIILSKQRHLAYLYNIVLLFVCTYYAYKTRNIPRNFNEAKYVAFTMYGACVMYLAFIIISMTDNESTGTNHPLIICYRISFTTTLLFLSFFAPKLYIILCKPEKNKKHSMAEGTSSSTVVPKELISVGTQDGCPRSYVSYQKNKKVAEQSTQTE